jgi:hypothetical protein
MAANQDPIVRAADALERAAAADSAGRDRDWIDTVDRALAAVEQAVRQRAEVLREPDGQLLDVDRPRVPSPAVDRRTEGLERELHQFLDEVQALRSQVRGAAEGLGMAIAPDELAGALPVAPEAGAAADLAVFRQHARRLAEEVRRFEREETDLILDAVNTDIGAGD